ncbi:hypothetical protein BKA66DRAFT_85149 [Pyrenochaeta sp. MPI-SDFR-AT-0127]|nr:hypothetical protein BKA66DRAFT_85149 [Pyrenochaeta sp. MPI-SDFR-AT-0127]
MAPKVEILPLIMAARARTTAMTTAASNGMIHSMSKTCHIYRETLELLIQRMLLRHGVFCGTSGNPLTSPIFKPVPTMMIASTG